MPNMMEYLFGRGDKVRKLPTMNQGQQDLLAQLMQSLTGGGGQFGDIFGQFDPNQAASVFQQGVANPAMRRFQQETMPSIMERNSGNWGSGALNQTLARAARDLQENLASQQSPFMYQAMLQNMQNRMGGLNMGMGAKTFTPYISEGGRGLFGGLAEGFASGLGQGIGSMGMGGIGGGMPSPLQRPNPVQPQGIPQSWYGTPGY